MCSEDWKQKAVRAQAGMIALMLVCLLPVIFKPCIWYDESFTMNLVRKPVPELLRITSMDVHPPLYYLVVKLFVALLGDYVWVYHLPSLLCYLLILVFTAVFFSKAFDPRVSLLVTAAFCSVPNMIKYALELRMYSMSMLLILSGMYVSYFIIMSCGDDTGLNWKSLKLWVLLALVNVAAAYTHYFAGVAAVGISVFLLLFLLLKYGFRPGARMIYLRGAIYCLIMVVLYLPWLPTLISQMSAVNKDYWIEPLTEASLHYYPDIIFESSSDFLLMALKVFFLLGLFVFAAHFSRSRRYFWQAGCFLVVGVWLLFGVSYSLLRSPILVPRYLVMLLPLIWIPVLSGYASIKKGNIHYVLFVLFAVCFIRNYEEQYDVYSSSDDIQLVEFGQQYVKEGDVFFHFYSQTLSKCAAYFPENDHYILDGALESEPVLLELVGCRRVESFDQLASIPGNIWSTDDDYMNIFTEAGFRIETFQLGEGQIHRIYKED